MKQQPVRMDGLFVVIDKLKLGYKIFLQMIKRETMKFQYISIFFPVVFLKKAVILCKYAVYMGNHLSLL